MPTDKEIEEAVKRYRNPEYHTHADLIYAGAILRDAYLYMKAERDKYKAECELLTVEKQHKQNCYNNLKESAKQNDIELNKEIDKYKAIVEAVAFSILRQYWPMGDESQYHRVVRTEIDKAGS